MLHFQAIRTEAIKNPWPRAAGWIQTHLVAGVDNDKINVNWMDGHRFLQPFLVTPKSPTDYLYSVTQEYHAFTD